MKTQRILVALTVINLVLLVTALAGSRSSSAEGVAPVLRGRAFEIVDDRGHVRASITVLPADPAFKMPDGTTGSPETVLFRLINSKAKPNVKIESTETGTAMYLGGDDDPTSILLGAKGTSTSLVLTNRDGKQQLIKP
jgi:hypothetical protein